MKLTTLLEYQRCYDLLRDVEGLRPLNGREYLDALRAKGAFDEELAQHIKETKLEISDETDR